MEKQKGSRQGQSWRIVSGSTGTEESDSGYVTTHLELVNSADEIVEADEAMLL